MRLLKRTKHKIRRVDVALALLEAMPGSRVLDAPCGHGLLAQALVRRGHEVWACDVDPAALLFPDGVRFDAVDLNGPLPYPDDHFDHVVSLEGIEHLEDAAVCLREFARVLRPGGRLVLSTPNVNSAEKRWTYFLSGRFSGFKPIARRGLGQPIGPGHSHVTVPYLPTLVYLLERHGLRVDRVTITMVKTRHWLYLPVALPMWISGRRAPAGSVARLLGSWPLLLGRSVVLRAVKPA